MTSILRYTMKPQEFTARSRANETNKNRVSDCHHVLTEHSDMFFFVEETRTDVLKVLRLA